MKVQQVFQIICLKTFTFQLKYFISFQFCSCLFVVIVLAHCIFAVIVPVKKKKKGIIIVLNV